MIICNVVSQKSVMREMIDRHRAHITCTVLFPAAGDEGVRSSKISVSGQPPLSCFRTSDMKYRLIYRSDGVAAVR